MSSERVVRPRSGGGMFLLIVLILGCTVASSALVRSGTLATARGDVLMGLVEFTGGTKEVSFSAGACQPWGTVSIFGQVQNKTGVPMKDLTIELTASAPANSKPPQLGSGSIGSATFDGNGISSKLDVNLGNGLAHNHSADATIGLAAPAQGTECTDFKLKLTPSGGRPGVGEFDILEPYVLSTTRTMLAHGIESHGNGGVAAFVTNIDPAQRAVSLEGSVNFRGQTNSVVGVLFVETIDGPEVPGATVVLSSNNCFTIHGISLDKDARKMVLIRFDHTPASATSLELRAAFLP